MKLSAEVSDRLAADFADIFGGARKEADAQNTALDAKRTSDSIRVIRDGPRAPTASAPPPQNKPED